MKARSDDVFFKDLYQVFDSPLTGVDCGKKCGPYNEYGVPVCCDIQLVVPAAYEKEWEYLKANSDLWKLWHQGPGEEGLEDEVQDGQVLIQCLGYQRCQRPFRSLTCRAFPFFPYLSSQGEFLGLAYYLDFRENCWIISNLELVSQEYKTEFKAAYQLVFAEYPRTRSAYLDFSTAIREEYSSAGEPLPVLAFNGDLLQVDPSSETVRKDEYNNLAAFGPFQVAKEMAFPDELEDDPG